MIHWDSGEECRHPISERLIPHQYTWLYHYDFFSTLFSPLFIQPVSPFNIVAETSRVSRELDWVRLQLTRTQKLTNFQYLEVSKSQQSNVGYLEKEEEVKISVLPPDSNYDSYVFVNLVQICNRDTLCGLSLENDSDTIKKNSQDMVDRESWLEEILEEKQKVYDTGELGVCSLENLQLEEGDIL